jgi:hypothetical protein
MKKSSDTIGNRTRDLPATRIYRNFNCESEDSYLLALGYVEKSRYAINICSGIRATQCTELLSGK